MNQQATETFESSYKITLDNFSGPLDLLLYLIRKDEISISDIPVARITSQYLEYVRMMTQLNLEVAGEFVLMAATLIHIKTRMLLPRDEDAPEEDDPRNELMMALIEYRKFREAGELLREKAILEEQNVVPELPLGKLEGRTDFSPATSLFDLLTAFRDVMKRADHQPVHEVVPEEISIEERMAVVERLLTEQEFVTFLELFADAPRRIIAIVTFIAMLEMARTRRIRLQQSRPFAEILVGRGERFGLPPLPLESEDMPDEPVEEAVALPTAEPVTAITELIDVRNAVSG